MVTLHKGTKICLSYQSLPSNMLGVTYYNTVGGKYVKVIDNVKHTCSQYTCKL